MVQLDTRLPLGIQQPNFLNALAQGTQNAGNQAALMRQAEGQNLFRQHGAGAMQGDTNALNALAGFDPVMAQGMDINRQENRRADQRIGIAQQQLQLAREAGQRAAMEAQDRRAAMQEAQQGQQMMRQLAQAFASGDERAFGAISAEIAGQPLPMEPQSLQTLDAFLSGFSGGLSSMVPGSEFRQATPEEAAQYGSAAGQFGPDGRFYPINPPSGMTVEAGPDGSFRLVQGPGASTGGDGYANLRAGSGEVRVPDPSSPTGTRLVAEPGGELDRERQEQEAERAANRAVIERSGQALIRDGVLALDVLERSGRAAAGVGSLTQGIPESPAGRLRGYINSIKGNIAIDSLLKIKASGAGLGAIPQAQLEALAGLMGNLDQRLPPDELAALIRDIVGQYEDIVRAEGGDPFALAIQRGFNPETGRIERAGQQPAQSTQPRQPGQGAVPIDPPPAAVQLLMRDPSPEALREFDEAFGEGAAARALGQ